MTEKSPETDLTQCPPELRALDPNAEKLWLVFLRRTGISMSHDRKRVIDNGSHRALIIRSFGIPSLNQRLSAAKTERERARVWWREAAACSAGDTIPDLTADALFALNPFIVTPELRYADPRGARLAQHARDVKASRGRPTKSSDEKRETAAQRQRKYRAEKRDFVTLYSPPMETATFFQKPIKA
ncbi:MAG TPA: hypothetical protein VJN90_08560 [Candidatus Acidoferrales bacterium]|nr:hypothetical protein [Candidatus Acidoferrales bacterium]